jgi:co-chaperonin GroES (HSP10)
MAFEPLHGQVFVEETTESRTEGGIVLPDSVRQYRHREGVIRAVGTGITTDLGIKLAPMVAPGDRVWFLTGVDADKDLVVPFQGTEVLCIDERTILAVDRDRCRAPQTTPAPGEILEVLNRGPA